MLYCCLKKDFQYAQDNVQAPLKLLPNWTTFDFVPLDAMSRDLYEEGARVAKELLIAQWVYHTSSVLCRRVRTPGGIETHRTSRSPLYARERERERERESVCVCVWDAVGGGPERRRERAWVNTSYCIIVPDSMIWEAVWHSGYHRRLSSHRLPVRTRSVAVPPPTGLARPGTGASPAYASFNHPSVCPWRAVSDKWCTAT